MKERLLVFTALEETWGSGDAVYFLGEWCKLYSKKDFWSKLDSKTQSHHWNDRSKLKKDHDYLKDLYERILIDISARLNEIHAIDKPVDYWRIVLGPWLLSYVAVLFDRWETLRIAKANLEITKIFTLKINELDLIPNDYTSFSIDFCLHDLWNQMIFQRIIKNHLEFDVHISELDVNLESHFPKLEVKKKDKSLRYRFGILMDRILSVFESRNQNILFYQSYFPPVQLAKLSIKLRIIPRLHIDTFSVDLPDIEIDQKRRNQDVLKEVSSEFEKFISKSLFKDIPKVHLELYFHLLEASKKIKKHPTLILTANGHWNDELFKLWTAEETQGKSNLIISDHGGSFPPLFDYFNHDESIAYKRVTWFIPTHSKHVSLPPSKLSGLIIKSEKKYCSVIGYDLHRYVLRATAYAMVEQNLTCLEDTVQFCKALNLEIFNSTRIKPKPDFHNLGWETFQRYSDILGADKIEYDTNYYSVLKKSKLIVCTYSDTTFSEALTSGLPTILVHRPEFFEKIPEAQELIKQMEEANIIFSDPLKAANHVNKVWFTIDEWWQDKKVVEARNAFFEIAVHIRKDWIMQWVNFLKNEIFELKKLKMK
ncbi:MAG: LIC12162 family protein [Leptospiraceae bacterium]|nr:LIC12162 family protein [Leptospiraceae bacterium]